MILFYVNGGKYGQEQEIMQRNGRKLTCLRSVACPETRPPSHPTAHAEAPTSPVTFLRFSTRNFSSNHTIYISNCSLQCLFLYVRCAYGYLFKFYKKFTKENFPTLAFCHRVLPRTRTFSWVLRRVSTSR